MRTPLHTNEAPPAAASEELVEGTTRLISLRNILSICSLAIVLVAAVAVAQGRLPSFDGAMNLQVSRYLAEDGLYARYFGGFELFPIEVQTNGLPILLGALSIKIGGLTELSLQIPNLIFVAALAITLLKILPAQYRLGGAAPILLLGVPQIWGFALGGLGEISTFVFQLLAVLLLARGLTSAERTTQTRLQLASFCLAGVAAVTKTVGLAILPALAGMVFFRRILRRESNWLLDVASVGAAAAPIAAFEVFRLVQLGDLEGYLSYWRTAAQGIVFQAGLGQDTQSSTSISLGERIQTLSTMFGNGWVFAVLFVLVPLFVAAGLWAGYLRGRRSSPAQMEATMLMMAGLSIFAGLYLVWWHFVTPLEKAWPRRIIIGILAIYVLYLLLIHAVHAGRLARSFRQGLLTTVLVVLLGAASVPHLAKTLNWREHRSHNLSEFDAAVAALEATPTSATLFGYGWWSAPQFGLYMDRKLEDLAQTPTCDLVGTESYLAWDRYASAIASPTPPDRNSELEFELVAEFEDVAQIYRVSPRAGVCTT